MGGERVDLEDLLEEGRPAATGLGWRQPWRGDDGGRPVGSGRRRLLAHAPRTVGIPAVVPRGDVALIGDVHQHPGQKLQRVHGLRARRGSVGLVRPVRDRRRGPVIRQPLQRDRIPRAVAREARRERAIVLGHP
jgi:hypothetical protein